MKIDLRPKRIIVVGASGGIGLATAQKLLDNGAVEVLLAARNRTKLEHAASQLKVSGKQKVEILEFDITKIGNQEDFIQKAEHAAIPSGGGGGRTGHL